MIKKFVLYPFFAAMLFISCNSSKKGEYDTRAVESLDKLTETIGDLTSLSYQVTSYIVDDNGEETNKTSDIYLQGSNKMFLETRGAKGNKSFWYDGEKFSYFLYNQNEYDILKAPDNTLKLIDSINSKYGIYFPAADFLYPTLTDDILDNYDQLLYYGDEKVDAVDCILLMASNKDNIVQIWIENNNNLPHKMTIESKTNKNKYYEALYSNWKINPKLPDVMFKFQPPKESKRKKFIPIK